ncbi:MAG: hypothetical protein AB4062_15130 [Crocosphaera sp.]
MKTIQKALTLGLTVSLILFSFAEDAEARRRRGRWSGFSNISEFSFMIDEETPSSCNIDLTRCDYNSAVSEMSIIFIDNFRETRDLIDPPTEDFVFEADFSADIRDVIITTTIDIFGNEVPEFLEFTIDDFSYSGPDQLGGVINDSFGVIFKYNLIGKDTTGLDIQNLTSILDVLEVNENLVPEIPDSRVDYTFSSSNDCNIDNPPPDPNDVDEESFECFLKDRLQYQTGRVDADELTDPLVFTESSDLESVPEPTTNAGLIALGLLGIGALGKNRFIKRKS